MGNRFTEKAENALNRAVKAAENMGHTYIGTEHLLLALAEEEFSCSGQILKKYNADKEKIKKLITEYSGTGVKTTLTSKNLTPRSRYVLESSYNYSIQYGNGTIGTEHILLGLITERDSVAFKILTVLRVNSTLIKEQILLLLKEHEKSFKKPQKESGPGALRQYGKNLCELALEDKFDPVIGREDETNRIIRILCRKTKNNPCLIGEAGVGKTAIAEGLAQRIVSGDVPEKLKSKTVISIDLTSMVAGAKYRGDFEERIKSILSEVTKSKDIILFIDEIHTIVGAGAAEGAIDASNILKPQLARGDIQVIGATTFAEYHKYIEKDAALERRFQPVKIEEPDEEKAKTMLLGLKERYEKHHNVIIDNDAIDECVLLSSRYINDRFLPDKAIDLLDEACVLANINHSKSLYSFNISEQNEKNELEADIKKAIGEYQSISNDLGTPAACKAHVDIETIKESLSEICGIPKHLLQKNTNYEYIEKKLSESIVGQDERIKKIINVIKANDFGFFSHERPRGIFLFTGESGVGKTELAIKLSRLLFAGNDSLIRYDMSEFSEKQSISKFIGSPPGYVGHDNGGTLVEEIKKKPYSVVLFDEIEKADKDVMNILLQIADHGFLRDSCGRNASFRNAVIIMTSNVSAHAVHDNIGFILPEQKKAENEVSKKISTFYAKELIARFDEVITFKSLDKYDLCKIAELRLADLKNKLAGRNILLQYSDEIVEYLADKSFTAGIGARPLLKKIKENIETKIVELLYRQNNDSNEIVLSIIKDTIEASYKIHTLL